MDRERAQDWLDRYVAAWLSYEPDEIAALFSEDASYRYHPHDDPTVGREAVVASWLGQDASEGASTRDAPGTYEADYAPIAIDGDSSSCGDRSFSTPSKIEKSAPTLNSTSATTNAQK